MTPATSALLGGLACLVVASACLPLVIAMLRRAAVLDVPGARSSHVVPTPRGGGLALVVGMLVALLVTPVATTPLVVAVAAFGAIGLMDDVRDLPVSSRFLAQLLAGALVTALLLVEVPGPWPVLLLGGVLSILWMCAFVNAFNFMDGINGISGAHALLAGASFAALGVWADAPALLVSGTVVGAAALAFLPWNAPRAKVFLGDVGSYALGAGLAVLAVVAVLHAVPVEAALAPLAVHLVDTGWTLVRRIRAGEPWRQAHRSHVYQRLCDVGWSHARVAGLTALLGAAVTLSAAVALTGQWALRALGDAVACLLLVGYLMSPTYLATRERVASIGSGAS